MKEDNENKQTDAEQKQTDAEQKQTDAKEEQTDAKEEQPGNKDKQTDAKTKETPAENPNQNAKTPKPHIIQYNIDGKEVRISFDDWQHFKELRRQLASGIPLDDDLIKKMKPILAEVRL